MELNKYGFVRTEYGFFWKLRMLLSNLLRWFFYFNALVFFSLIYYSVQYEENVGKDKTTNMFMLLAALLFIIAGLLIKIVEYQSVNAKLNNHPE